MAKEDIEATLEKVKPNTEPEETPTTGEEVAAEAEEVVETSETKPQKGKGKGAQDRIKELVGSKKELEGKLEALETTVSERDAELAKLVNALESRETSHKIVEKINELYNEPEGKFKDIIETLDKAVQGVEVEIEEAGEPETAEEKKHVKDLKKTREELEETQDALADQEAKRLIDKAENLLDKYFDGLPEDAYNDEDITILSDTIGQKIDWDAIEEDPDTLNDEVAKGFKSLLEWYGKPKGSLAAGDTTDNDDTPEAKEAKKEASVKDIIERNWGELKDSGRKDRRGKPIMEPAVSDDDFASILAHALKKSDQ